MNTHPSPKVRKARLIAVGTFAVFALLLMGVGYSIYRYEKSDLIERRHQTLAAINNLKSREIQQWRKERTTEIARAAKDSLTIKGVRDAIGTPENPNFQKELQDCLQEEMQDTEHSSALLFDSQCHLLATNDPHAVSLYDATRQAIRQALDTHSPAFSNFYRASDGVIHIDLAAPVCDQDGEALAVLILRHEAATYLYPLITSLLVPSESAESLLVMLDGNEVVYLSDVRHRANSALSLRFPLSDATLPAARVAQGQTGAFIGKDYRGIQVLSDLLPVAGSPWFIVSKMDEAEILAEVHTKAAVIALIIGLFILLAAVLVAFYYRGRQTRIMANLITAEQRKAEALETTKKVEERHSTIILAAMDGFCLLDSRGSIQEVNKTYCQMTGYSEAELLTLSISDVECGQSAEEITANVKKVFAEGSAHFESQQRRKDGSRFDVDISAQHLPTGNMIAVFIRDITFQKQARNPGRVWSGQ